MDFNIYSFMQELVRVQAILKIIILCEKVRWNLTHYFYLLSSIMLQSLILIHITLLHLPGKCRLSVGLELCRDLCCLFKFRS